RRAADGGAVLGGGPIKPVGHDEAAAARHVLRDHRWIAGNVRPDMGREQAAIEIVAAAWLGADIDRERAAAIEILDRIGGGRCGGEQQRNAGDRACLPDTHGHGSSLPSYYAPDIVSTG